MAGSTPYGSTGPQGEALSTYVEKLQAYKKEKAQVEVSTDVREVTGIVVEVGADFVCITSSIEKPKETSAQGADGTIEKSQVIIVYELETLLKLSEIRSISKVLRSAVK